MPRSTSADPFMTHRFRVAIAESDEGYQGSLNSPGINSQSGFKTATGGEITSEVGTYREGHTIWAMKVPGPVTVSPITLSRGLIIRESDLWQWVLAQAEGRAFRADVKVAVMPRAAWGRGSAGGNQLNMGGVPRGWEAASRVFTFYDCVPIRVKFPDMDADGAEVGLAELEFEVERFDFEDPAE